MHGLTNLKICTDVLGQLFGPMFKCQEIHKREQSTPWN